MKNKILVILGIAVAFLGGAVTEQSLGERAAIRAYAADPSPFAGLPVEKMREFAEVFSRIRRDYVEEISEEDLIARAISGMVSSLDPHSSYLAGNDLANFHRGMTGEEFGGLGIYVGTRDGFIEVISPIFGTPADRANMKSGDLIITIDGTSTQDMSVEDAVKKMRGKVGTSIALDVLPNGGQAPRSIELIREKIVSPSVVSSLLRDNYAYMRINRFQDKTVENLVSNLNNLYEESNGDLKGIILDLRNNPGGYLLAGVDVAAAFLPPGETIVSDKGRSQEEKIFYGKQSPHANHKSALSELQNTKLIESVPLVVLVNNGSASASEIVAGALQDTRRAVIVGTRTYGKASVQSIAPLHSTNGKTALRLTTARYYTPAGTNIQARGIQPDIAVNLNIPADGGDENAEGQPADNPDTAEQGDALRPERPPFIDKSDNQFDQALSVLRALSIVAVK